MVAPSWLSLYEPAVGQRPSLFEISEHRGTYTAPGRPIQGVPRHLDATSGGSGISPGAVVDQLRVTREIDASNVLPTIQTPTRVMHASEELFLAPALGRKFAELVPGATFVEMPGGDHLPYGENGAAVAAELRELLTGKRPAIGAGTSCSTSTIAPCEVTCADTAERWSR